MKTELENSDATQEIVRSYIEVLQRNLDCGIELKDLSDRLDFALNELRRLEVQFEEKSIWAIQLTKQRDALTN